MSYGLVITDTQLMPQQSTGARWPFTVIQIDRRGPNQAGRVSFHMSFPSRVTYFSKPERRISTMNLLTKVFYDVTITEVTLRHRCHILFIRSKS